MKRLDECPRCSTVLIVSPDDLRTIRAGLGVLTSDYNEGQHEEWRNAMSLIESIDRVIAEGAKP